MKLAVVGAGLTGATIARLAAENGHSVDVFEKRSHLGGNCYDMFELNSYTHIYGPHLFHTSDKRVVNFLGKFTDFTTYFHKVSAWVNGGFIPLPFSLSSLTLTHPPVLSNRLIEKLIDQFGFNSQVSIHSLLNHTDDELCQLGTFIYKNIFAGYSIKQWGIDDPLELDKGVLDRIPVRINYSTDYFNDTYQMLPTKGYSEMIKSIFSHPNINITLNHSVDPHEIVHTAVRKSPCVSSRLYSHIFYCGMLDQLFEYQHSQLPYRSLNFKDRIVPVDEACKQRPNMVCNYPCNFDFTRITDYSFIGKALSLGPTMARIYEEYPSAYQEGSSKYGIPYYPLFTKHARQTHKAYMHDLLSIHEEVTVCGRLGDYKYYDMDDAIIAAFGKYQRFAEMQID